MFANNEKNLFDTNLTNLNQYKSIKERQLVTKSINVIGASVPILTFSVKAATKVNQ